MPLIRTRTPAIDTDQLTSSFDSIAKLFAPPTAQELYVSQKAQNERASGSRLTELYRDAADPNVNPVAFANRAGIAGAFAPNQSLEAVDRNNRTTLSTNAADNARALQQTTLQQQGDTTRTMLAPVGQGATRFVPPTIASAFGVPQQQTGVVELNQGQQATLPDGRTLAGANKPLSIDEVKAAVFGQMPTDQQQAITFGSTPTPSVQTPDGPRITTAPLALGQTPAPDMQKAQLANYKRPDGGTGTARFDQARGWIDTQAGTVLPAGVQTYSSALQGNQNDTGLGQATTNTVEQRLLDAANVESTVRTFRDLITRDPGAIGIVGGVRGVGQDAVAAAREAARLFDPAWLQTKKDIAAGLVDPEVVAQFQTYNPNIPQAKMLELLLAGQVAKMIDPSGRISNDRMKQVMEGLGGGGYLSNVERTKATLQAVSDMVDNQRSMLKGISPEAAAIGIGGRSAPVSPVPDRAALEAEARRRGLIPQLGAPEPDAEVERWVRGPDGKLMREMPSNAPVRRRYDPATGRIE
ncbi:hypothetical protein [Methylobacterium trifolii]|uniref:Peptidoglycan-binding protein n=1 Tax=Methylobacterium trifolii TaxID=1003092 RepID=A0ABQ4U1Q0_9HYPH|nr:hypothetical protein [Methylobacterium trifolii]GJE60277.1 hypothetical protein MPOCJGCO_2388 [Methylobacterium trifolii]